MSDEISAPVSTPDAATANDPAITTEADGTIEEPTRTGTSAIAASVLAKLEAGEPDAADAEPRAPLESAADSAPVAPVAPVEDPTTEAGKFLKAQGHIAKKSDGKPVWLPYQTVEKMLDRYVDQHKTGWEGERTALSRDRDELRTHVEALRSGVAGDPESFLRELSSVDQRYARFLQPQSEPARATSFQADANMPQPDVPLEGGGRTYSVEGLQNLIQWAVDARVLPKVDERLRPITEREETAQRRQAVESRMRETYHQTMQEAQTWPMFGSVAPDGSLTPFQSEVLSELRKDSEQAAQRQQRPQMTLRQAYLEVYARQQAPDKVRERVLAELKQAPSAPSLVRRGAEATGQTRPRTSVEIAREMARQLEG